MTALPSGFEPIIGGLTTTQNLRTKKLQFGDGYSQVSVNTTNNKKNSATLNFLVWGDTDLNTLIDFFDTLAGDTLTYTLPNESSSREYHIDNVRVDYVDSYERRVRIDISTD